jgi:hypothetical protein
MGLTLRVEIHLLTAAEGGRTTPVGGGYRPLCVVGAEGDAKTIIGLCQLEMNGELAPGGTGQADLVFAAEVSDLTRSLLAIGSTFGLAEGPYVIGEATVRAID